MAAAYAASTRSTVAQSTVPLVTSILTGTPIAVVVLPQDVPAVPALAPDEHPPSPSTALPAISASAVQYFKCRSRPIFASAL